MANPSVFTLGVIDLVDSQPAEPGEPRRHNGHFLGLSADLLETQRFAVLPAARQESSVPDPDLG